MQQTLGKQGRNRVGRNTHSSARVDGHIRASDTELAAAVPEAAGSVDPVEPQSPQQLDAEPIGEGEPTADTRGVNAAGVDVGVGAVLTPRRTAHSRASPRSWHNPPM